MNIENMYRLIRCSVMFLFCHTKSVPLNVNIRAVERLIF